jgi:hypothetical protein
MKLRNRIVGALGLFLALQAPVLAACGAMGGGQGCSGGRASILLLTLAVGFLCEWSQHELDSSVGCGHLNIWSLLSR